MCWFIKFYTIVMDCYKKNLNDAETWIKVANSMLHTIKNSAGYYNDHWEMCMIFWKYVARQEMWKEKKVFDFKKIFISVKV